MASNQPAPAPQPLALYLHVPFCHFKCYYCDFNTFAGIEPLLPSYVDALTTEIRRWGQALSTATPPPSAGEGPLHHSSPLRGEDTGGGETRRLAPTLKKPTPLLGRIPVHSIFFGGGTPSLLSPTRLERILTTIADAFALQRDAEITLEANPESVETQKVRAYRSLGINRMSMGAQSFDDTELKMLGRLADSARVKAAFSEVRAAGLDNVNLDLIYGLPHQTRDTWVHNLTEALALAPEHLSLYALTVEERTPFHRWVQEGSLPLPDPDLAADMYEDATDTLTAAGYIQYEISNWARKDRACRHNLVYWRNGPFVGVGPGAHSFLHGARFAVMSQPREYIAALKDLERGGTPPPFPLISGKVGVANPSDPRNSKHLSLPRSAHPEPVERSSGRLTDPAILKAIAPVDGFDPISEELECAETLILGLRLNEGVDLDGYAARYGRSPLDLFRGPLEDSIADGLVTMHASVLRLTPRGRLLANEVFVRVLAAIGTTAPSKL